MSYNLCRVEREDSNIGYVNAEDGEEFVNNFKNKANLIIWIVERGDKKMVYKIYKLRKKNTRFLIEKIFWNGLNRWEFGQNSECFLE